MASALRGKSCLIGVAAVAVASSSSMIVWLNKINLHPPSCGSPPPRLHHRSLILLLPPWSASPLIHPLHHCPPPPLLHSVPSSTLQPKFLRIHVPLRHNIIQRCLDESAITRDSTASFFFCIRRWQSNYSSVAWNDPPRLGRPAFNRHDVHPVVCAFGAPTASRRCVFCCAYPVFGPWCNLVVFGGPFCKSGCLIYTKKFAIVKKPLFF
jgi:hypothetical protein